VKKSPKMSPNPIFSRLIHNFYREKGCPKFCALTEIIYKLPK
jgi:hypothetical protein